MVSLILYPTARIFTDLYGLFPVSAPAPQLHWTLNMPVFFKYHFAPTSHSAWDIFHLLL